MTRTPRLCALLLVLANLAGPVWARDALFRRGDANQDGALDLSDATRTLGFLFLGTGSVDCRDAADANDDGGVDIADPIRSLGFLFLGTAPPPAPFEECGSDPTGDRLDCETFAACDQPPPAGEGLFDEAVSYDPGMPFDVMLGDLDGDGAVDLVVAKGQFDEISVGLGRGDGTFGKPVEHGFRRHGRSIAAGDLDGDGALDLVVGSQEDIMVLPGAGDGTFGEAATYELNRNFVTCVALDDLDGDGVLDLAAANPGNDEIAVLLGVGDGTFRDSVAYPVSFAVSLALGDLDGDRVLDLVVVGAPDGVSVLRGVGDGTFGEPVLLGGGEALGGDIALGDLDKDGALDIAVVLGLSPDFKDVLIFLGRGDGTFADPVSFGVGRGPLSVAVGDLDRDGMLDLAVANGLDDDVSVLIGAGDGTFCDAVDFPVGDEPWSVALGDPDGDGAPDLVTANPRSQDVSILLSRQD